MTNPDLRLSQPHPVCNNEGEQIGMAPIPSRNQCEVEGWTMFETLPKKLQPRDSLGTRGPDEPAVRGEAPPGSFLANPTGGGGVQRSREAADERKG